MGGRDRTSSQRLWYTVWRAETDEVVALGDARDCAAQLGISYPTFRSLVSHEQRIRRRGQQRYDILAERLTAEEWAAMEGETRRWR